MLYPFLVFGVSGQIAGEESFLVKKPPNEKRHHYSERDKPPVRAERQRRAKEVQGVTRVHRMANDRVWPGRNFLLILDDLDGCGSERVLSINEEVERKPNGILLKISAMLLFLFADACPKGRSDQRKRSRR